MRVYQSGNSQDGFEMDEDDTFVDFGPRTPGRGGRNSAGHGQKLHHVAGRGGARNVRIIYHFEFNTITLLYVLSLKYLDFFGFKKLNCALLKTSKV